MSEPIVHVVQEPMKRGAAGVMPKFDITPAEKYGRIVYLLNWSDSRTKTVQEVTYLLEERLEGIRSEDFILMSGAPQFMAIAAAIGLRNLNGLLTILYWEKHAHGPNHGDYIPASLDIDFSCDCDGDEPAPVSVIEQSHNDEGPHEYGPGSRP